MTEDTPQPDDAERPAVAAGGRRKTSVEVEFLLRFADAGHNAGYPSADLEARLTELARSLGVQGLQISATPTMIELSVGSIRHQKTYTIRERPATVDLDALARLDDLVLRVLDGNVEPKPPRSHSRRSPHTRCDVPGP